MSKETPLPLLDLDEDAALRQILEGTATATGEPFFRALVENLARALGTQGAWVTEYLREQRRLRALAFWMNGQWIRDYAYDIAGTPCQKAVEQHCFVHIPDNILALFPGDYDLQKFNAASYMGAPLTDVDGKTLGLLAVMDSRPMRGEPRAQALFRIFAARASAELQRMRAEAEVQEREEKLARLVDSALDAILELDNGLRVTRVNPAAEKVFGGAAQEIVGRDFRQFLSGDSVKKLADLSRELDARPAGQRYLWIPGGLTASGAGGSFPAEATLSRFEVKGETFYTLILRNVNDRLEAERRIESLTAEAEYLREELRELQHFDEIVGRSGPLLHVLRDINQVAGTDATVLILGETGTGKELVARAIHNASRRAKRPLVKVNCAAIPANLIESEFFGHEKGAFTGALTKRDGRFALAHGGTIFLDEIGDLPLDLQAKLLRVLQEGEFEPVGSSRTQKVDVRVIAATNRDLAAEVKAGKFREDLFYRLNVFPIRVPPLRERGDDISLLAAAFAKRFAQKMGRKTAPLSPDDALRLKAYPWPGNVRELQNVIERAVITAQEGRLNLDRALPEVTRGTNVEDGAGEAVPGRVHTQREMEELERRNILLALKQTSWRVAGETGAAKLLGMNPSTLSSRMKALDIKRPASVASNKP